jgi:hypothetical protein
MLFMPMSMLNQRYQPRFSIGQPVHSTNCAGEMTGIYIAMATHSIGDPPVNLGYFSPPVILPPCAKVTRIKLFAMVDDPPGMTIWLRRSRVAKGNKFEQTLKKISTTGYSSKWRIFMTGYMNLLINNTNSCYYIDLFINEVDAMDVMLHHVEIHYTTDSQIWIHGSHRLITPLSSVQQGE